MEKLIHAIQKKVDSSENRLMIGISGHGASGKTTFTQELINGLGKEKVAYLNTDPYILSSDVRNYSLIPYSCEGIDYKYKMTACHPAAHAVSILERDLRVLKEGKDFLSITNHYVTGQWIAPKKVTIVEGMSTAFVNLNLFDLTLYFYTDSDTELERRLERDISERGTKKEYLIDSHQHRRIQYDVFMHPYSRNFDIVIQNSNQEYRIEKNTLY